MKDDDDNTRADSHEDPSRRDQTDRSSVTGFEQDSDFEEPERDTDYASAYREDHLEEEEFLDSLFEQEGTPEQVSWTEPLPAPTGDELDTREDSEDLDLWSTSEPADALTGAAALKAWEQEPDAADERDFGPAHTEHDFEATEDDDWTDEEDYPQEETEERQSWPLGLIAVAVLALLLLSAGGYGVVKQRSATQEEIRQLQAALATSVEPAEAAASREALQEAEQRNTKLQTAVDVLTVENRRLTDMVAGLESQLQAQQAALAAPAVVAEPAKPEPPPEPKPAKVTPRAPAPEPASSPAPTASGSGWFVNFASYGVRDTASSWAGKIQPSAGTATIATIEKNGRKYYRVRVINLPDRASADEVARQLASQYGLPELWVGRE